MEVSPFNLRLFRFEDSMHRFEAHVARMQKDFELVVSHYHKMKTMEGVTPNDLFHVQTQLAVARFALNQTLDHLATAHNDHRDLVRIVEKRLMREDSQ